MQTEINVFPNIFNICFNPILIKNKRKRNSQIDFKFQSFVICLIQERKNKPNHNVLLWICFVTQLKMKTNRNVSAQHTPAEHYNYTMEANKRRKWKKNNQIGNLIFFM